MLADYKLTKERIISAANELITNLKAEAIIFGWTNIPLVSAIKGRKQMF